MFVVVVTSILAVSIVASLLGTEAHRRNGTLHERTTDVPETSGAHHTPARAEEPAALSGV
ncbi:MAG: hypothetical protein GX596_00720 [Propionibacterium sp.]|nr:hypothetical protein [Propionibacterium sp.]